MIFTEKNLTISQAEVLLKNVRSGECLFLYKLKGQEVYAVVPEVNTPPSMYEFVRGVVGKIEQPTKPNYSTWSLESKKKKVESVLHTDYFFRKNCDTTQLLDVDTMCEQREDISGINVLQDLFQILPFGGNEEYYWETVGVFARTEIAQIERNKQLPWTPYESGRDNNNDWFGKDFL